MRMAIVDDRQEDSGLLSVLTAEWAEKREIPLQKEVFPSAEAFLFRWAEKAFDILLLDVEMDGMDGVTLAKQVRREDETVQLVFITGYSDYIAEGYEVAALHYLMKPVRKEKLFSVLDRAFAKLQRNRQVLNLEISGELFRVPLFELRYLESAKNYVTLHAKETYTVKRPLKDFEGELDSRFFRLGRGFIVNLERVQKVTRTEVVLDSGERLPLPRNAYEPLNRAIINQP